MKKSTNHQVLPSTSMTLLHTSSVCTRVCLVKIDGQQPNLTVLTFNRNTTTTTSHATSRVRICNACWGQTERMLARERNLPTSLTVRKTKKARQQQKSGTFHFSPRPPPPRLSAVQEPLLQEKIAPGTFLRVPNSLYGIIRTSNISSERESRR